MYRVKYYTYENLHTKYFETLHDATQFTVYKVNTGNVYAVDLIRQITPKGLDRPFFCCYTSCMIAPFKTKEEASAFIRKVMGPPTKTLEGKEREQVLLLLAMIEPFRATNNQHSWTEYYMIGETEYHVTTFPNEEPIIDEMVKE